MSRRVVEDLPLPLVIEEPTPEGLTSMDRLNLGYEVGARYRIWTHEVDEVLGYTENGTVVVRGENGRIRRHLTPVTYGKHDRVD